MTNSPLGPGAMRPIATADAKSLSGTRLRWRPSSSWSSGSGADPPKDRNDTFTQTRNRLSLGGQPVADGEGKPGRGRQHAVEHRATDRGGCELNEEDREDDRYDGRQHHHPQATCQRPDKP